MSTTIESEIRALEKLETNALIERYRELTGKEPRRRYAQYLRKRVAYALQERAFGGLNVAARRRIRELASELKLPLDDVKRAPTRKYSGLRAGMTLTRVWKGQEVHVQVREDGFEWSGQLFTSLSAVANAISGTHWNGRVFFGLKEQKHS